MDHDTLVRIRGVGMTENLSEESPCALMNVKIDLRRVFLSLPDLVE